VFDEVVERMAERYRALRVGPLPLATWTSGR
jgi:hypothetical protein